VPFEFFLFLAFFQTFVNILQITTVQLMLRKPFGRILGLLAMMFLVDVCFEGGCGGRLEFADGHLGYKGGVIAEIKVVLVALLKEGEYGEDSLLGLLVGEYNLLSIL